MSPQVQALVQALQTQLQQMNQQMQMMGKELTDRQKDRDVILENVSKTFEAKVLAIAQKMEAETNKKEMHMQSTIGRQLAELVAATASFEEQLKKPQVQGQQPTPSRAKLPGFSLERDMGAGQ
jgi:phage terminase small subunit